MYVSLSDGEAVLIPGVYHGRLSDVSFTVAVDFTASNGADLSVLMRGTIME